MASAQNKRTAQRPAPLKKGKTQVATRRKRKTGGGIASWILFPVLILIVAIFYPEASVVLVIGLLPTFCAMTVAQGADRGPRILTIALFNLSGIIPIILELSGPRYASLGLMGLLTDVYAWFVMYGSAALGVVANWLTPFAAAAVLTYLDRVDIHKLQTARKKLVDEWGEAVSGDDAERGR